MLDFNRFEVLTFDCYGTLIDWEDGILRCLHHILAAHGKDVDDATILQLYGEFEASAEQGEYRCYREILRSVVGQFGKQLGFTPTIQEVNSLADSLAEWKPWPDTAGRCVNCGITSSCRSFLTWTTIFSPPLGLNWEWNSARSSRPSRRELTNQPLKFSS